MKDRVPERGETEEEIFHSHWFPKWLQWLGLCHAKTKSLELLPGVPCGNRGPKTGAIFCFPRHINGELNQKWSSKDCCPYGMPPLQIEPFTYYSTTLIAKLFFTFYGTLISFISASMFLLVLQVFHIHVFAF